MAADEPLLPLMCSAPPEKPPVGTAQRWAEAVEVWFKALPWRRIGTIAMVLGVSLAMVVAYVWRAPLGDFAAVQIAKATGATVQSIVVSGAVYTGKEEFATALGLNKGDSLVGFDARGARGRIENLPWVRLATVERQLPATVKVTVYEHVPLARVEDSGEMWVVGRDGRKIITDDQNNFVWLPLLQGVGAPLAAGDLFATLATWPQLMSQLKEARYVGGRRWDLLFTSGVTVLLPEKNVPEALSVLARLEEARHVLTLNAGYVDLRLPDRVVLRLPEEVKQTPVTDLQGLKETKE